MTKRFRAAISEVSTVGTDRTERTRPQRSLTSRRLVGAATIALVFAAAGHWMGGPPLSATNPPPPVPSTLQLFKNYFITGDHVVRGVSLWRKGVNGKAVVDIPELGAAGGPNAVPVASDIVAAFLYVQTSERTAFRGSGIHLAKFNGYSLGPFTSDEAPDIPGSGTFAKQLNWDLATPPCWSLAIPGIRRMVTYRVDVLRFLTIDPATGKQSLTAKHRIEIPDGGTAFGDDDESAMEPANKTAARAVGASLVVLYRDPTKPLKATVIYDGGFTKRALQSMTQRMVGFYDPLMATPGAQSAKMTHIVGDGRLLLNERLSINGQTFLNPFRSANGPKWDNFTANVALAENTGSPNDGSTIMTVDHQGLLRDCVTWSAIIINTPLRDPDQDGLPTVWETTPGGALLDPQDPSSPRQPDLQAMGADPDVKDLFVEFGHFNANLPTTYGGVLKPAHSHRPDHETLKLVGDLYKFAPVDPKPDGTFKGIRAHFDLGNGYPTGPADEYIIRDTPTVTGLARGGEAIDEMSTVCQRGPEDPQYVCQYSDHPGTVGWKTGYAALKNEIFNPPPLEPDGDDPCDLPGNTCERRFDSNRDDTFHYFLIAHALGIPKASCLVDGPDPDDIPDTPDPDPTCELSALFHTPVTNSGIHDVPGGGGMMTAGAFLNAEGLPVGSPRLQASTIAHELGHGWELGHGGPLPLDPAIPRKKNCAPQHHSIMNWAYQLELLPDADGKLHLDYSRGVNAPLLGLPETGLTDTPLTTAGVLRYRSTWYAPLETSNLSGTASPVTTHCDGSPLLTDPGTGDPTEPPMVRIKGATVTGAIDWNSDGTLDVPPADPTFFQDVNFDGLLEVLAPSDNEWAGIHVNTVGASRSVGGTFINKDTLLPIIGPMSLDVGRGDTGRGDTGAAGRGDTGRGDTGRGDTGRGAFGLGEADVGNPNEAFGEITLEIAEAQIGDASISPPTELTACLTDDGECVEEGGNAPVRLNWTAPEFGRAVRYDIYRFVVDPEAVFPPADLPSERIGFVAMPIEGPLPTTFLDTEPPAGVDLAYFVRAQGDDESMSPPSNFARVSTPGVQFPFPDPPQLVSPVENAVIPQNDPQTGCALLPGANASRGRGYQILFDWSDVESAGGTAGYNLVAQRQGAALPIVNVSIPVEQGSQFLHRVCNAFAEDANLTGWEWRVQTRDVFGQLSAWSPVRPFSFAPCRLETGAPCSAPAPVSARGNVTDPSGDTFFGPNMGDPDLISGTVEIQENFVTVKVRFLPGTFNPATANVQFQPDMDQNPTTGHPGSSGNCVDDANIIGLEYIVNFGASYGTQAQIAQSIGGCNQFGAFVQTAPGSVIFFPDGMDLTFPLSLIGNDGQFNFKMISFIGQIRDTMTNVGTAPGVVSPIG